MLKIVPLASSQRKPAGRLRLKMRFSPLLDFERAIQMGTELGRLPLVLDYLRRHRWELLLLQVHLESFGVQLSGENLVLGGQILHNGVAKDLLRVSYQFLV